MKAFVTIVALLLLAGGGSRLAGQTRLIDLRSHSGSISSFHPDGPDNFGISPEMAIHIDSVQILSDTSAIEFTNRGVDTVDHKFWNNPKISLDSLQRRYPGVKFIGFEQREHHAEIIHRKAGSICSVDNATIRRRAFAPVVTAASLLAAVLAITFWRGEKRRRDRSKI
jgi:hypothetical protein